MDTINKDQKIPVTSEEVLTEKIVSINRSMKVTKGGKNLNFSALVVVGNENGKVGFAIGKASEVSGAIKKGINKAKQSLVSIPVEETTIPHTVVGKFGSTKVLLKPASLGTGVIACSVVRSVCDASGIKNILTKVLTRSNNPINIVKATFSGLNSIKE
jgi:small subunit ribosomal protein S5